MITVELKCGTVLLGTSLRQSDSKQNVYYIGNFINGILTTTATFNKDNVFKTDYSGITNLDSINTNGMILNSEE